ncbi:hypothetical protein K0M31_005365 [Melipona bicolor]|uniref:Homeobox domain-containing protein n=1 Tax=Melipona bicolor TaxID=60889 RepID=A0AA40FVI5_9HYME|nr:hypothetical protein K0M31_005365 [Melipona bicolor]
MQTHEMLTGSLSHTHAARFSIEKVETRRESALMATSRPDIPGFLLQPFRKPKRIRTAFSPSQLLKLEHAFEKNHYVVGAERKQLAQALSLTETQVTSSTYPVGSTLYPTSDSVDPILIYI